jgi:hypothetical protein
VPINEEPGLGSVAGKRCLKPNMRLGRSVSKAFLYFSGKGCRLFVRRPDDRGGAA